MSLNKIELSPLLVASLYTDTLVESKSAISSPISVRQPEPVMVDTDAAVKSKHEVLQLILVKYPAGKKVPAKSLTFLKGVLAACQLSLEDVDIVNITEHKDESINDLLRNKNYRNIILFGIELPELSYPVNFPEFQVQKLGNATHLSSPPLDILENDKVLKSKLWVSLRRLFNI